MDVTVDICRVKRFADHYLTFFEIETNGNDWNTGRPRDVPETGFEFCHFSSRALRCNCQYEFIGVAYDRRYLLNHIVTFCSFNRDTSYRPKDPPIRRTEQLTLAKKLCPGYTQNASRSYAN